MKKWKRLSLAYAKRSGGSVELDLEACLFSQLPIRQRKESGAGQTMTEISYAYPSLTLSKRCPACRPDQPRVINLLRAQPSFHFLQLT